MKNGSRSLEKNNPPDSYRGRLGRRGEDIAAAFFIERGFTIIDRNWRCRFGEIDLIVEKQGEIRFVEVKLRKTHAFGYPESSVTAKKLRHLGAAMELWLRAHNLAPDRYQADVLAISCLSSNSEPVYQWIEGV